MTQSIAQEIAHQLLSIEAVQLKTDPPFQWTSGLYAPIYTDNRLIMSYPEVRKKLEQAFADLVTTHFPEVEVIAGTATAGIPHAAFIAAILDLPMIYVRDKAKGHGKQSAIEGTFEPGAKIVLIEDLISTGKSVLQAADTVAVAGGDVLGVGAVFSYQLEKAKQAFAERDLPLYTLSNYETLVTVATAQDELKDAKDLLFAWHEDPIAWSQQFEK